jgi:transposase
MGWDRACLGQCQRSGATSRSASRTGVDFSHKLGRHRWVVERTLAWLGQFRLVTGRYERHDDTRHAFLSLGCALICFPAIERL